MICRIVAVLALVGVVAGCGGPRGPEVLPVTGKVTLRGEPIEKIRVVFYPVDVGQEASATTDAQGKFKLEMPDGEEGAVTGQMKVVLYDTTVMERVGTRRDEDLTGGRKSRISTKYQDKMGTTLTVAVGPGKQEFEFDVEPLNAESTVALPAPTSGGGTTIRADVDPLDPRTLDAAEETATDESK